MRSAGSVEPIDLPQNSQRFLLLLSIPEFPTVNSERRKDWGPGKWKKEQ